MQIHARIGDIKTFEYLLIYSTSPTLEPPYQTCYPSPKPFSQQQASPSSPPKSSQIETLPRLQEKSAEVADCELRVTHKQQQQLLLCYPRSKKDVNCLCASRTPVAKTMQCVSVTCLTSAEAKQADDYMTKLWSISTCSQTP